MTDSPTVVTGNPYVGPRTYAYAQRQLFFGREREARDLLARVVSERLLLFYAQSGAGKSSLLHTRLIPQLRDEEGFAVLPVGRVSGELPAGISAVSNIFTFNLMASIDQGDRDPARFDTLTIAAFLAHLASEDGLYWAYEPAIADADRPAAADSGSSPAQRYVLIIDQFEEIVTAHPDHWQERTTFFQQLNQAMLDDPNLWVVLTLREDYVAALDPYAQYLADKLRARFSMERMGIEAALEAICLPASLGGRPFTEDAAQGLVNNLRMVRVPGQDEPQPGQYVEPVQLQVVCYQMWENIASRPLGPITADDLQQSGDVDTALATFFEAAIAQVLAVPKAGVSEERLRQWFSTRLITEAGTRGTVFHDERTGQTAGMPNTAVDHLVRQFLLRMELRAGGAWVELVHDRFVDPILESNRTWLNAHESTITQAAQAWQTGNRSAGLLITGEVLRNALAQAAAEPEQFGPLEREFLNISRWVEDAQRSRSTRRLVTILALLITALLASTAIALGAYVSVSQSSAAAARSSAAAANAEAAARATAEQAQIVAVEGRRTAEAQAAEKATAAAEMATLAAKNDILRVTAEAASAQQATVVQNLSQMLTLVAATPTPEYPPTETMTPAPVDTATPVGDLPLTPDPLSTPPPVLSPNTPPEDRPELLATPTIELPTPTPNATATYIVEAAQAVVDQYQQPATTEPEPSKLFAVIPAIELPITTEPDREETQIGTVRGPDIRQVLEIRQDWVKITTSDGVTGWIPTRILTFEGSKELLPPELQFLVTTDRPDLPFVNGRVYSPQEDAESYPLVADVEDPTSEIVQLPIGTEVIVVLKDTGSTEFGSGVWYLVLVVDPSGKNWVWRGYLPTEVVEPSSLLTPTETPLP